MVHTLAGACMLHLTLCTGELARCLFRAQCITLYASAGNWYIWGQQPSEYVAAYQRVFNTLQSSTCGVDMVRPVLAVPQRGSPCTCVRHMLTCLCRCGLPMLLLATPGAVLLEGELPCICSMAPYQAVCEVHRGIDMCAAGMARNQAQ